MRELPPRPQDNDLSNITWRESGEPEEPCRYRSGAKASQRGLVSSATEEIRIPRSATRNSGGLKTQDYRGTADFGSVALVEWKQTLCRHSLPLYQ